MQFTHVTIQNFKSYKGQHTFSFTNFAPGVHFITGRNEVDDDCGSNGAGKSTLFDAIHWALYGRTLRGVRAASVRSWGLKESCCVELQFCIQNTSYAVKRTWGPVALELSIDDQDFKPISQDDLDALIGLKTEQFQSSVIIGQASNMFFDLGPTQKLALFSDVMNLEHWMSLSGKASNNVRAEERAISTLEVKLSHCKGQLEKIEESLSDYIEEAEVFDAEKKENLAEYKKEHDRHVKAQKDASAEYEKIEKQVKVLRKDQEKFQKIEETDQTNLHDAGSEVTSYQVRIEECDKRIAEFKRSIKTLKESESGVCSRCGQVITKKHVASEVQHLEAEIRSIELDKKALVKKRDAAQEEYAEITQELLNSREKLDEVESAISDLLRSQVRFATANDTACEALDRLEEKIEDLKGRDNPYDKLIVKQKNERKRVQDLEKEIAEDIEKSVRILEAHRFWVKGFKNIRLFLLEEALETLTIECNNNLLDLGLGNWSIEFDVERENTSGGISRGFQVFIHSPYNDEAVPWECWSGGESQRLRLAATMGLANLILAQKNLTCNIEVWDEPTRGLSDEGFEDLLDLLRFRAKELQKQIWFIDHHNIDHGAFDTVTTIVKDSDGSHILDQPSA